MLETEKKEKTFKEQFEGFNPFLGRLIVELLPDDTEKHLKEMYGIDPHSKIQLPDAIKQERVPCRKGKIIAKSPNSFGERFEKWYGVDLAQEGRDLKLNDIVWFIYNQTYPMDIKAKYHVISDEHIIGYQKEEVKND